MKNKQKIVALIPARSGSRRVKNKNIRLLVSKPLIAYTIESALKCKSIDRVIVSTDSPLIAKIAKKYGAEVPFLRPASISKSHSTEYEFHSHLLDELSNKKYFPEYIVNLYPTCPLRTTLSIEKALKMIISNPMADSLRSIRLCSEHPYKMWEFKNSQKIVPFVNCKPFDLHTAAYQSLPKVFIQNASIYITKPKTLKRYKDTIGRKILGFPMSEIESLDINNEIDWQFLCYIYKKIKSKKK